MTEVLQFGIPSFDELFGRTPPESREKSYNYGAYGIKLGASQRTTSISLIGPDGTGKSVFGLHLASQYLASAYDRTKDVKNLPTVLYVSTDLKHDVAGAMWTNFGLEHPNKRDFPFYWAFRKGAPELCVKLGKLDPAGIQAGMPNLSSGRSEAEVLFVDLVSKTMGDDWGFINRLLAALLETPAEGQLPHLLILDAVEGFETLVGETDAFGETSSRRARIAQIMRTAGRKCHICFIVEEPKNDERFPEEFVTDVVVRLRNVSFNNYSRRSVEITKARGQAHVRGQHTFVIRDRRPEAGKRSPENADEPPVSNSYVHVFASLHYVSREQMKAAEEGSSSPASDRVAAFGITYLDEMLARVEVDVASGLDDQGLPAQKTAALIGEVATQKTSLATAFLARTFRNFVFHLANLYLELESGNDFDLLKKALRARLCFREIVEGHEGDASTDQRVIDVANAIRARDTSSLEALLRESNIFLPARAGLEDASTRLGLATWLAEALPDNGAAVLFTTGDQDRPKLVGEFYGWLNNSRTKATRGWPKENQPPSAKVRQEFDETVMAHIANRTICRRLELHDLSSATLFQIIQRSIERAQQKVFLSDDLPPRTDKLPFWRSTRFAKSWNIRVVLDDLSTLKDAYPEIGSDPIFLPFLLSFLEREGVTSLVVDSQPGRPGAPIEDALDQELRALVPHKIFTWSVPFMGGLRHAITIAPQFPSGLSSRVREVRWKEREKGQSALVVDPELELYDGLEGEHPHPIPLEIRLYAETEQTASYIREENEVLGQLFTPTPANGAESGIIRGAVSRSSGQYEALFDLCNLQTHTLLPNTLVFQIDEFWGANRTATVASSLEFSRGPVSRQERRLCRLGEYLDEVTSAPATGNNQPVDPVCDPFGVFQGKPVSAKKEAPTPPWKRHHYFTRSSQGFPEGGLSPSALANIDRVPYTWDFGFLLCPSWMWEAAGPREIEYKDLTVSAVWKEMPSVKDRDEKGYVSWREFLGACKTVAAAHEEKSSHAVRPLDVSTLAGESLSCLLLEMWSSEIADSIPVAGGQQKEFLNSLGSIKWNAPGTESLIKWLGNEEHLLALYRAWLLLIDVIATEDLVDRTSIPQLKTHEVDGAAAATRHWYKTACGHQQSPFGNELSIPVRLPGHFSVRGDWFLAVAGVSRSLRLGHRALDVLSTRSANFRRMTLGIGLPTRDIAEVEDFDQLPTALVKGYQNGHRVAVTYGELIGAGRERKEHFAWLWRSQLHGYHRHARVFQGWIAQAISQWDDLRSRLGRVWRSGFSIYDEIEGKSVSGAQPILKGLDSWKMFSGMCELLKRRLEIASNIRNK